MNLDNQNPPLRIRENDGNPNVIPVFDIVLSDNLNLLKIRPGVVSISASTSAALASPTYAPTGGSYITYIADAALTNERILTASDNIVATTSSTIFWISAVTSNISGKVDTSTTLTAIYPLTGGGTLSTSRSFSVDTAFLVNTGRTISAGTGLIGGGDLSTDRTISLSVPVVVTSGGTGAQTFTSFGVLFGSGTTAIQALPVMSSGWLVVGSMTTTRPHLLPVGSDGQMIIARSSAIGGMLWISTAGPGASPVYAPTGGNYISFLADSDLTNEKVLTASDNIVMTTDATTFWISAVTNSATGGGASTAGNFITFIADAGLSNERILTASDNIVATTSSTIFWISAITSNISGKVDTSTTLTAIYPITGGGTLATNRSFSIDTAFLVNTGRTLTAGSGLSGGGNLSADQSFSVNTDVRDKIIGWFAAGNLSTAMLAEEMRVRIPFNMEPIRCDLAVTTTSAGAAIICNLFLFATPIAAGTGIFATANRPSIPAGASVGSGLTFNPTVLHAGSFLGLRINQVGSTTAGSDLTVTLWTRSS